MPLPIMSMAYQKAFSAFEKILFDGAYNYVGDVINIRRRFTLAEINAGTNLLPPYPGFGFRMVDVTMIAIGGAAGGATTVDILATQSGASVKLLAAAIAGLTQDALLRAGAANAAILANGLSLVKNDSGTAITINKTGAALTTLVSLDVNFSFVYEAD